MPKVKKVLEKMKHAGYFFFLVFFLGLFCFTANVQAEPENFLLTKLKVELSPSEFKLLPIVFSSQLSVSLAEKLFGLERSNNWEELLSLSDGLLKTDALLSQDKAWLYYYQARAFLGLNNPDKAQKNIKSAIKILPENIKLHIFLLELDTQTDNAKEAEAVMKNLLKNFSSNPETFLYIGKYYESKGQLTEAVKFYKNGIARFPQNTNLYLNIALAFWQGGDLDNALAYLSKAIELNPNDPNLYNDRGIFYLAKNSIQAAGSDFNTALKLNPQHAGALLNRGNFLANNNKLTEALDDYNQGVKLYPADSKFLLARAEIYCGLQSYSEALVDYQKAFTLNSKDPLVINELAWFLATCPDSKYANSQEAIKLAELASLLSIIPEPSVLDTLAAAYAASGDFIKALKLQAKALSLAEKRNFSATTIHNWKNRYSLYKEGIPYTRGKLEKADKNEYLYE